MPGFHLSTKGFAPRTDEGDNTEFPNRWSQIRHVIREPAAEFIGTGFLCWFGTAGNAKLALLNNPAGSSAPAANGLYGALIWAIGIGLGVWVSGSISGGHINPIVTISQATFRGFPWKKVPIYLLAQLLGGIVGAALTYADYVDAIDTIEGGSGVRTVAGTAGLFGTYAPEGVPSAIAFFEEFFGGFLLVFVLVSALDKKNGPPPPGRVPIALFFVLLGIGLAFGAQTGAAVNPARDLGPRILTAMAGYGRGVFNYRDQYWIWCGVIAPILGALVANFIYDAFIYTGEDSILNRPNAAVRAARLRAPSPQEHKSTQGSDMV